METDIAIPRRMGRNPLNEKHATKATPVRFDQELLDRIDAAAGPNNRAKFIRAAVVAKLEKEAS